MKINCNWLSDFLRNRRAKKLRKIIVWHKRFVIYHRFGPRDCRLFEVVERRFVLVKIKMWDSWNDDYYYIEKFKYIYRTIK